MRFNRVTQLDRLSPERRQSPTAAAVAPVAASITVKRKNYSGHYQQPGATVVESEVSPSLDHRSGLMNLRKQMNLPGPTARSLLKSALNVSPAFFPDPLLLLRSALLRWPARNHRVGQGMPGLFSRPRCGHAVVDALRRCRGAYRGHEIEDAGGPYSAFLDASPAQSPARAADLLAT